MWRIGCLRYILRFDRAFSMRVQKRLGANTPPRQPEPHHFTALLPAQRRCPLRNGNGRCEAETQTQEEGGPRCEIEGSLWL